MLVRNVLSAAGAPGQVFKLPEEDVRARLETLSKRGAHGLTYRPSAIQGLLTRDSEIKPDIAAIFAKGAKSNG
jgi:hypothetical protein